ncbi:MAG: phytoene/squalene synthase family protein [Candidatus Omnitrophica bacterium]|nr:phytoene/squalene synthase family protein [Candidatus Omnitrophota bacterium]
MDKKLLKKGFLEATAITRKYARSFYLASHLLPRGKRQAAYAIYAICRLSDNSVDDFRGELKSARLNDIKLKISLSYRSSELREPLLMAFRHTILKYQIPQELFDILLNGMEMDINITAYKTFTEIYDYCFKVAGVVGLIMLKIFGCASKEAEQYAIDLGVAMQLTNILRDIKEDYGLGRIYLPVDELNNFAVTKEDLALGKINQNFIGLLKFHIKRARDYYERSSPGIRLIKGIRPRLTVCIMKGLYSEILTEIERRNYDVFYHRVHVNSCRKLFIIIKTAAAGKYF